MSADDSTRGASTAEHYAALAQLVKADGCSSAPDLWFKVACNEHDVNYRTGKDCDGKPITRAEADARFLKRLRECAISPFGRWVLAPMYYAAVRSFGGRHWQRTAPEREEAREAPVILGD